jgi:hypothetical protein
MKERNILVAITFGSTYHFFTVKYRKKIVKCSQFVFKLGNKGFSLKKKKKKKTKKIIKRI